MVKTYLFTYGTLQDAEVQHAIFGRTLEGKADAIKGGYCLSELRDGTNSYPILKLSENTANQIEGIVYEINEKELPGVDQYEGSEYKRIWVTLSSGKFAWCYVES